MRFVLICLLAVSAAPAMAQTSSSAAPAPQDARAAAAAARDARVVCRVMPVTGSLVRTTRECATIAEWRRRSETANDGARALVDGARGRPPGN